VAEHIAIDTNVLWSFAVVGRLDLLEERFAHRLVWTDAVHEEVRRNSAHQAFLRDVLSAAWLGEPHCFGTADLEPISIIRDILADPADHEAMHLGEAEAIYLLETKFPEGLLFTDDRAALDLAQRRRLKTMTTLQALQDCHAMGEIGCPDAWDLMRQMESLGRSVRAPERHTEVC
jgi:predicted nucleic acid-binding protein